MKNDVVLRSTDDRLCQLCFDKNQSALKRGDVNISPVSQAIHKSHKSPVGGLTHNTACSKGSVIHSSPKNNNDTVACAACCEAVATSWLVCDVCAGHFHPVCVKLTDSVANKLQTLITAIGWVCPGCRSELVLLRSSKSAIVEMVAAVKDELQQLRTEFESYRLTHPEPVATSSSSSSSQLPQPNTVIDTENPPLPTKHVLAAVHQELSEKERRKSNVVVSGMQEVDGIDDVDSFSNLCETCLPVKPAVIRHRCRRLGRKVEGKVRPFLVSLSSESSAAELLQCARLLRQTSDADGIYINADLTPAEALAAFQAREKRRARRSTGSESPSTTSPATSSVPSGEIITCS